MRKLTVIGTVVALVLAVLVTVPAGRAAASDAYDTLRLKWSDLLTGGASVNTSDSDISARIASITSTAQSTWDSMDKSSGRTYLWSDLPFPASGSITNSYNRLESMALAYRTTGSSLQNNATLGSDIISALDWLNANEYNTSTTESGNWWDYEIGSPLALNDVTVLMYDNLTSTQITNYMNTVDKFQPTVTKTGANRMWQCLVIGVRGIIVKDSTKISAARDGLSQLFQYETAPPSGGVPPDGFYQDGSFIQHNYFSYNGGYGAALIYDMSHFLYLLNGSAWQVVNPKVSNVYQWVYNSFEPFIYEGAMMSSVRGREISRDDAQEHAKGHLVVQAVIGLSLIAPQPDASKLQAMVKEWVTKDTFSSFYSDAPLFYITQAKAIVSNGGIAARGDLVQYKQFPNMDRAVMNNAGYSYAISMDSSRIADYESINSENLKGWHTADGMTYLYNADLGQYDDSFWPTVNSYRLPGTTVEQNTTLGSGTRNTQTWVGGTSLSGLYGTTGMQLAPVGQTLQAKKSWFMFGDKIVALGSQIASTDGKDVETIVENRKLNSSGNNALTVNGTSEPTTLGWSQGLTGVNWAQLSGSVPGSDIGYYFPGGSNVNALREARTGKWSDIDTNGVWNNTTPVTRNYLSLALDQGVNPTNGTYSYVELPNKSAAQMQSYAANPDISILANDGNEQVVKDTSQNIVGANFWVDGAPSADLITSSAKSSVMTKETSTDLAVSVSDPTMANAGTINVTLNRSASSVISSDPGITITQLTPTIKFTVNVAGAQGKSFGARFSYTYGDGSVGTTNDLADLALGKPATATSTYSGNPASAAVDGDDSTAWGASSGAWPQSLTVDLGAPYSLGNIETTFDANETWKYKLEGSTDNASWTTLVDNTASGVTAQDTYDKVAGSYRYVKLTITGSSYDWAGVDSLRVYGIPISRGKPATGSTSYPGYPASAAVDGDGSTLWAVDSASYPRTLQVDLGQNYSLYNILTRFVPNANGPWKYKIEGSTDNVAWTTLVDRTADGVLTQEAHDNVYGVYRYVRLSITASDPHWASVSEFSVFGGTPVSQGKSASASSSYSGYPASLAVDTDPASYWSASSSAFPQSLTVDLGANTTVAAIQTKFYKNETWQYKIEGSTDNSTWTVLSDRTSSALVSQDFYDRVSGSYRYFRITVTHATTDWAAIRDFSVFSG